MSADAPNMIVFGGRAEAVKEPGMDALTRFNRMAMDNPMYGHNLILERLNSFDNSARFSNDDEAELDAYVQTLFLEPLGERGYAVNGDPYGEFKKMQAELTGETYTPENSYAESAEDFMNSFSLIFGSRA
jgi:hypothetical protein